MAALGDVYELRTVCRGPNGSNQINVRHYRVAGIGASGLTDQAICDGLGSLYGVQVKPLLPSTATYSGAFLRRVTPTVGVQLQSLNGSGPGTNVGSPLPEQCTCVVTLRAALAPARTRGRAYFPAGVTNQVDTTGGTFTAAYVTSVQAAAVALWGADIILSSGGNSATMRPVILKRAAPHLDYQITTVQARTYVATQRRRSNVHGADRVLL